MSKEIDKGKIIKEHSFKLNEKDDIKKVHVKYNKIFPKNYISSNKKKIIKKEKIFKTTKNYNKYFKQRTFKDGKIYWKKKNSAQIYNFVRALTFPYHCAYTFFEKKIYFIPKCVKIKNSNNLVSPGNFFAKDRSIIVKTKRKLHKIL